jgi:hypothetical protein
MNERCGQIAGGDATRWRGAHVLSRFWVRDDDDDARELELGLFPAACVVLRESSTPARFRTRAAEMVWAVGTAWGIGRHGFVTSWEVVWAR